MYIGEGVPYVHRVGDRGGRYPMYTFGQQSRTEPEYPLLSGPSASGTQFGVLGWTLSARANLAWKRPFWGI